MKKTILAIAILGLASAACQTGATQTNTANTARANQIAANQNTGAAMNHNVMNYNQTNSGAMNHDQMNHGAMDHASMQSSPDAAQAPYDLQFLDTMIAHHQAAVDMARSAESKAQHQELKTMARNIIRDQEREIAEMKRYREQWFAARSAAINMEMAGMHDSMKGMDMNKLNAASGNEFDLLFLEQMTPHHLGAVVMAKEAMQKAEHPEIKKLAQAIIREQEKEIRQMNEWKIKWKQ